MAPFKIFSDLVNCDYIILYYIMLTADTGCQCCHTTSCRSHMSSNRSVGIVIQKLNASLCVVTAVNGYVLVNLLFLLLNYYSVIFRITFVFKIDNF